METLIHGGSRWSGVLTASSPSPSTSLPFEQRLISASAQSRPHDESLMSKILVVDDEPDLEALVVQKFRRQIREGEVSFLFAHDGVEALEMLSQQPDIDMVLSDINMPRMDGLSLLARIQETEE